MSKTLFRYIFLELLKFFLLASGVLTGIMSFGGLLRPLTRQGLGLAEVLDVVVNLMPAMSTYSLPVAALFATTLVYGRLSADNELTAMRAAGISHLAIAFPGFVLGLVVSVVSIVMLSLLVPASTLRVERVIYSNVARLLATSIERNHEFQIPGGPVLSAQAAAVLPPDPNDPDKQTVVLEAPLIVNSVFENRPEGRLRIPREFYTARKATIHIRTLRDTDEVEMTAQLDGGATFPRRFQGAVTGGVEATQFGPLRNPSQMAEKPKFMDLARLRTVAADPGSARRVKQVVADINRLVRQRAAVNALQQQLSRGLPAELASGGDERHTLVAPPDAAYAAKDGQLSITLPDNSRSRVRFETARAGNPALAVEARKLTLRVTPNDAGHTLDFELVFDAASVRAGASDEASQRDRFRRSLSVPMPPEVAEVGQRTAKEVRADASLPQDLRQRLDRALIIVRNEVAGELNARAAFAVSCTVLVVMGVALGMMFRSGHYLTAFAISVGPALLCILLTTTGQHSVESVPNPIPANWTNPLTMGLILIWSGNTAVALLAGTLFYRLHRT